MKGTVHGWTKPWFTPRRIEFRETVEAIEFSRRLDGGDTVPGDHTIVCLGLGEVVNTKEIPLAETPPKGRPRIEDRAWVPSSERVKLLRKAMGDNRFFVHWQKHRRLTRKVITGRKETNKDSVDFEFMPSSLREAQDRAATVADDRKLQEICNRISAKRGAWKNDAGAKTEIVRATSSKLASKRRKVLASKKTKSLSTLKGALSGDAFPQCHRCLLPINLKGNGCQCLHEVASPKKKRHI